MKQCMKTYEAVLAGLALTGPLGGKRGEHEGKLTSRGQPNNGGISSKGWET